MRLLFSGNGGHGPPYASRKRHAFKVILLLMLAFGVFALSEPRLLVEMPDQPQASPFELPAVKGGTLRLSDYRGKYLLVNFWATWCAPCRKEMPGLERASSKLRNDRFEVIAIHVGPDVSMVRQFLNRSPVSFTVLLDEDLSLMDWDVPGLPTTYLLNPSGELIYKAVGERQWDSEQMISLLRKIIGNSGE